MKSCQTILQTKGNWLIYKFIRSFIYVLGFYDLSLKQEKKWQIFECHLGEGAYN